MVCGVYCGSGVFPGRLVQHVKAFYKNNIVFGFFFVVLHVRKCQ